MMNPRIKMPPLVAFIASLSYATKNKREIERVYKKRWIPAVDSHRGGQYRRTVTRAVMWPLNSL